MMSSSIEEDFFTEIDDIAGSFSAKSISSALAKIATMEIESVPAEHRCGLLRRHAEYLYMMSDYQTLKEKRVEMLESAYNKARQGHLTDPGNFECAKVLCSTCGRLAEESSLKKKLDYGFKFKTYLDEAIAIYDQDFELTHMRGRFCYTVASLSFVERCAAKVIGQIPDCTYQMALDDLLRADQLEENIAENQFFIGKTYMAMGDLVNAKRWLQRTAANTTEVPVEQEFVDDAAALLLEKKLKSVKI
ncbi:Tetratricopeptide repeat protein [Caenorhabditis elegans]|uniref:Tetratricopeptide repeat protein n=1 Tax=Caenorhabditis elegans TaxID=6239 RepID=P91061_CAEEL|nr:Tetratricopeptide repeat protein [Caenorhabditis elegans]CCD64706.2 Tetratricopeptide repeat protein [Caenorhabditis elegans]